MITEIIIKNIFIGDIFNNPGGGTRQFIAEITGYYNFSSQNLWLFKENRSSLMKKNLCILFVAFVFGVSAFADKKADIEKLLQVSESNSIVDQIINLMIPQYKQMVPSVPEEYWDKAAEKMKNSGFKLIAELVPIYDKYFTESEIKELIAFYESSVGKKMVKNQPLILQDSMEVGQKWGISIAQEIVEDLQKDGYLQ